MLVHPFPPVFSEKSEILILGSFPSVKSREVGFPYGHSQNRFWKMLAAVYAQPVPSSIPEKETLILHNKLALWDIIKSCEITGSSDASIKNPTANDIRSIVDASHIRKILCNGQTSGRIYRRYLYDKPDVPVFVLPSTSPANAACSLDELILEWGNHLK